jgi:hypothetical protein
MKIKIPLIAIAILAAIYFGNKEEIKNMFIKETPVICDICEDECPCLETACICKTEVCKCPKCIS